MVEREGKKMGSKEDERDLFWESGQDDLFGGLERFDDLFPDFNLPEQGTEDVEKKAEELDS